ncbi:vesicle-associated membrane protein [Musa troglodytarum]|uniref:Vesicle-associated membrane protein n=1 Tax=Musa troglodytarum TaxID=320322 RepID=A0A9E7KIK0_9LILI|nr:vesicle-associated membrane protein [Musa troglodytarum]
MAEEGKEGWFIYGFVARGTVVLAEYTEYTGNFPAIAAQCLQKLLLQQALHLRLRWPHSSSSSIMATFDVVLGSCLLDE